MRKFISIIEGITPKVLDEQAITKVGDWEGAPDMISSISEFVYNMNWKPVGRLVFEDHIYTIARFEQDTLHFVVGEMVEMVEGGVLATRFAVLFKIDLSDESKIGNPLGYNNMHGVFAVAVRPSTRGNSISKIMYQWLITDQKMTILGDRIRYFGARKLWTRLSKETNVLVDIIDIKEGKVIDRDVKLTHGQYDHEFDQRV